MQALSTHPGSKARHPLVRLGIVLTAASIACGLPGGAAPPATVIEPTIRPMPGATNVPVTGASDSGEIIFHNGVILTMDPSMSMAEAVRIQGETIVSVGSTADVLAQASPSAVVIDLGGRTVMPGFVDAHSHMFGELDPAEAQAALLRTGITTTAELYVDEAVLQRVQDFESRGGLRVRLSTYLVYNNACGDPMGDWYSAYAPTRVAGERLRTGGIKIYADGGSCNVPAVTFEYKGGYGQGDLYFSTDELAEVLRQLDQAGWQVAIHAAGDRALETVLRAYIDALGGVNARRHRIEHNSVIRPELFPLYTQAGVVATIFGPFQTCITLGDRSRFRYLVPESHQTWEWPWRELLDANPDVHFAWHGDMPGVFGTNIFEHLYGFVTRDQIAEDGTICEAPDWLAANALGVDRALELMTMGAAYALDRETEVGSLTPGKLADLIILSDNPLAIEPRALADLGVLMTMIGGQVEYCAEGMQALCPELKPAPSSSPSPAAPLAFRDDFDGALDDSWSWLNEDPSAWSLSAAPGWLRIHLSQSGFLTAPPSNVLLRPAPDGDFDLRTWVRVSPSRNFELAGLIVYFSDDTLLQFGHGFCDVSGACTGDGYYFDNLQAGSAVGGNFASAGYGGSEDLLRLVRRGNTYTAYYFVDDTTWIEVGSHTVDRAPVSVGLIAAQAPSAGTFAEFDYFETVAE